MSLADDSGGTQTGWRGTLILGAAMGLATVALSALGSHAIDWADAQAADVWRTAMGMLGFHALALVGIAALQAQRPSVWLTAAVALMAFGSLLFCGTVSSRAAHLGSLPAVLAPVGGSLLMAGWVCLGIAGFRCSPA